MIRKLEEDGRTVFVLETADSAYVFQVLPSGHLEHLHYGRKITIRSAQDALALAEQQVLPSGNGIVYDPKAPGLCLEDICLEMSGGGKGDIREPFVEIVHADGSRTSDFLYASDSLVISGPQSLPAAGAEADPLPHSYSQDGSLEQLTVTLRDAQTGMELDLIYQVYPECNVISRQSRLRNRSGFPVRLQRLMSSQIGFTGCEGWTFTTFDGEWTREMKKTEHPVRTGTMVCSSWTGTSSSRSNPFTMLSAPGTTEEAGLAYGFNLVYSGNHYTALETTGYGKTRLVSGINPRGFEWILEDGEEFLAPEAVLSVSGQGFNGLSQNLHEFVREHIVRGSWKHKERPVLLNSWEAAYFRISERKILSLARAGRDAGIELFVVDDGWFGQRDDDTRSLGDWDVNRKKFPGGLQRLARRITELGLLFGIWVEPEMVNVDSDLYRAHPDWCLAIEHRPHSEGRNQRILDLTRADVQDYLIDKMSEVFSSADISYVKWDMNRIFSDVFSSSLPAEQQGEVMHRYQMGLYRILDELTRRFPEILFEGCASGGNRFDLGMLCYFPQIWASDNTDALCRAEIQTGYSYGYPLSVVSAHVSSCPNHQTLRTTPLESRFNTAAFGVLGYECALADLSKEELEAVKAQIALYKQWRPVLQSGRFYRGRTFQNGSSLSDQGNWMEWTCVSADRTKAVGFLMHQLAIPNTRADVFQARGLNPDLRYHFTNRSLRFNLKEFGSLVNMISPVHLKQDGLLHNLASRFVKMEAETEDAWLYGDALMAHGICLRQGFNSAGYAPQIRHFPDFASRIYFMEAEESASD